MDRRSGLLLAFALIGGLFFALTQMRDVVTDTQLADAHTPSDIAKAILGSSARVAPSSDKQSISIHYDLTSWTLTTGGVRSAYLGNLIRLVPTMFERIPGSSRVELVADNIFDTIQGREVRQPALSMMFTRGTAEKVDWSSVTKNEVARLADRVWVSPAISWR